MDKPAFTNIDIIEPIRKRWSPRAFSDKKIDNNLLEKLFEAVRWAPSSMNEQPWNFISVRNSDKENFKEIIDSLMDTNKVWAAKVPLLIISIAKKFYSRNNSENKVAIYDLGQAVAYLSLQATAEGLFVHQMGGFDKNKLKDSFSLPDGYEPVTVIAVGYPGNPDTLPDKLKEREFAERKRKPQKEFVFESEWEKDID